MISSDHDEVLGLSDQTAIEVDGQITEICDIGEISQDAARLGRTRSGPPWRDGMGSAG